MASVAYRNPIALSVRPATPKRTFFAAYSGCWASIAIALIAAPTILTAVGMTIVLDSIVQPAVAICILTAIHFAYRRYRPRSQLGDIAGVMGALFASLLLAAIISHAGLRFRMPLIDDKLFASDRMVRIDVPSLVRMAAHYPRAAYWLDWIYNSALPAMPLTAVGLVVTRQADEAWTLCFGFAASIVSASLISIMIPAVGVFAYAHLDGLGLPPGAGTYALNAFHTFHDGKAPAFDLGQMSGVVEFPSFHTVMALIVPYALRRQALAFTAGALWCALVLISTVPIGGHYATDLVAGAALWAGLIAAQRRIDGKARRV